MTPSYSQSSLSSHSFNQIVTTSVVVPFFFFDVNNGIARRAWARNKNALTAIKRASGFEHRLVVTIPNLVDRSLLKKF